jgi:prepilin-type N-terminal cleavage/methylation domain-containing protein
VSGGSARIGMDKRWRNQGGSESRVRRAGAAPWRASGARRRGGRAIPDAARRNRSGFTLIEVLVAVVLLATGIAVILEGLQGACLALERARDGVRMAHLAASLLGETEAALLDRVSAGGLPIVGAFPEPYDRIAWRRRIAGADLAGPSPGGGAAGVLQEIDVRAMAPAGRGTFGVTTYVWVPPVETGDDR